MGRAAANGHSRGCSLLDYVYPSFYVLPAAVRGDVVVTGIS